MQPKATFQTELKIIYLSESTVGSMAGT